MGGPQLERLKEQSNQRFTEFTASGLGPPESTALELLNRFATDGWVDLEQRSKCPSCGVELNEQDVEASQCPQCGEIYDEKGGVVIETVFVRYLAAIRSVDWVVAIHGMNTSGAWQEAFTWTLSTTWGRSVPVAVYKYGIVVAGVVMAWRRRKLQQNLREKLGVLREEALKQGYDGKPDVVAHSFGTWLFGHLLKAELERKPDDRLRFGRVILAGCVLRPDFDWKKVKDEKLVEDVLNHYGTADPVVPLAHATIRDSGPSGRRGFDGDQVINIRAEGFGHSDLLSIDKRFDNGATYLSNSYQRYWRPFLTLPPKELVNLPDRKDPERPWRQLSLPLRGTIFPWIALPMVFALLCLLVDVIGLLLWRWRGISAEIFLFSACGIGILLLLIAITAIVRWLRS